MIKILYAEDDAIQAKMCIDYLEKAGYQVFHAADGAQALSLYQKESPDLILMDVVMPQMTGFEVAKIIRRENVSIPILFISSLPGGSVCYRRFPLRGRRLHSERSSSGRGCSTNRTLLEKR